MTETSKIITVDSKKIGDGAPCYVIAEAGSNHNRDMNIAMKLIDAAKKARADAVKFQVFSADTIVTSADILLTRIDFAGEKSTHELFKKIEFDLIRTSPTLRSRDAVGEIIKNIINSRIISAYCLFMGCRARHL